jgi:RES domain-containing protein
VASDAGGTDELSGGPAGPPPADDLVAFRYCSYDVPFWVRPNTREGRWNRIGDPPTQYWALSPEAAWAELIRHEDLRTEEALAELRMPMWVCRVPATGIVDLCDPAVRARYGLTLDDLTDEDWTACQCASATLRQEVRGVIAPSAALPGARTLTLFGPRRLIALEDRPALASAVPGAVVAIGRPPPGLLVRIWGRARDPTRSS